MRTNRDDQHIASTPDQFYVTGGTLPSNAPSYVVRQADTDLYESLRQGEFCYVLNTRQMGKSSLMIRTANRLRAEGNSVAILDLTAVGQNLNAEQWYDGMLTLLGDQLDIEDELEEFWGANRRLGPMQRWMEAVRQVVLPRAGDGTRSLILFVDEIDAVRSLPFSADEFFAGIRECYNRRTQDPEFERLTFCLLGVATPADLIMESRMSPFNIGQRIVVSDFTRSEAAPLAHGLPGSADVLDRVLYWTGGHPYLTQRMCKALSRREVSVSPEDVDNLCSELFLSKSARETDDNLAFVQNRLLRSEIDIAAMLDMYSDVLTGQRVVDDETNSVIPVLRLSGVVRVEDGVLRVRNRIYAEVFDSDWVVAHMPYAELRRQRVAYRRGLIRAAVMSAGVIFIMAILAGAAALNARNANRLKHLANLASSASEMHEKHAIQETNLAVAAQKAANENARLARASAESEHMERIRADKNEQAVLAANRKVLELASQRKRALDDRQTALTSAIGARQRASIEAQNANRLLYIANMNLAQQAYDNNNIARVLDLLSESDAGATHAFEWGYWQRECHLDLETLRGHRNHVTAAIYLPDGRRVVTASIDHTVRLWDTITGRQIGPPIVFMRAPVTSLSLSGDGTHLAIGCLDQSAQVWDVRSMRSIRTFTLPGTPVMSVALNRDGSRLAAGASDRRTNSIVQVWDTYSGGSLQTIRLRMATVSCVAFSPDNRLLAAGGSDHVVHVWDSNTAKELHSLTGHNSAILCLAFSPDNKSIASGSYDNSARIWDLETDETAVTITGHTQGVGGIAYSPDGAWIATAGYDNVAKIWDSTTGQPLLTLKGHTDPVSSVSFSPDGARLVTGSSDDTARIWESTRRRDTLTLRGHTGAVVDIAVSPDGSRLLSAGADGAVHLWNTDSGAPLAIETTGRPAFTSVAYSMDGRYIATGSVDGTVQIIEAANPRNRKAIKIGSGAVEALEFSPKGGSLCVSSGINNPLNTKGNGVYLLSVPDGAVQHALSLGGPLVVSLDYSPNSKQIVTGGADNVVRIRNSSSGAILREWRAGTSGEVQASSYVTAVCYSHDGKRIAAAEADQSGSGDNTARVWDVDGNKPVLVLKGHANSLYSVAFSPDDTRIITGSADKTARLWDAVTGREVLTLKGHDNVVLKCLFTPDGDRIITCSADDTVKVWERAPDAEPANKRLRIGLR